MHIPKFFLVGCAAIFCLLPPFVRAADTDSQAKAREALLKHLPNAPGALALEIAQGLSRSREGCLSMLTAVEQGKVPASLLQDRVVLDGGRKIRSRPCRARSPNPQPPLQPCRLKG